MINLIEYVFELKTIIHIINLYEYLYFVFFYRHSSQIYEIFPIDEILRMMLPSLN
jgi:hypothetical protein